MRPFPFLAIVANVMFLATGCVTNDGTVATTADRTFDSEATAEPGAEHTRADDAQHADDTGGTTSAPEQLPDDASETTEAVAESDSGDPVAPQEPKVVRPFPHITVNLTTKTVEIDAIACLDIGWLEQVMCTPGTREHESLLVTEAKPSHVHAALLLAGHQPGSPGAWDYSNDQVTVTPPTGAALDIFAQYEREGELITEPVRDWIRDYRGQHRFPPDPWVFGGSILAENPPRLGGGEYYVADMSGSIIGLVTFGDEVIGFSNVLADQEAVQAPEWEVSTEAVPRPGTRVTVILQPVVASEGGE